MLPGRVEPRIRSMGQAPLPGLLADCAPCPLYRPADAHGTPSNASTCRLCRDTCPTDGPGMVQQNPLPHRTTLDVAAQVATASHCTACACRKDNRTVPRKSQGKKAGRPAHSHVPFLPARFIFSCFAIVHPVARVDDGSRASECPADAGGSHQAFTTGVTHALVPPHVCMQ